MAGHQDAIFSIQFGPERGAGLGPLVATKSDDGSTKLWSGAGGAELRTIPNTGEFGSVEFSPDGSALLVASGSRTAKIFDVNTGDLRVTLNEHQGEVYGIAFSPKGDRVATGSSDVRLFDAVSGHLLKSFGASEVGVKDIDFSFDDRFVASLDGTVKIWDAGLYGPGLLKAAYALLTDEQRAEVERERIRYWEVDPALLQ